MTFARTAGLAALFFGAALSLTLIVAGTLLGIPSADLILIGAMLARVGGICGVLMLLLIQPPVLHRFRSVRMQLVMVSVIATLLLVGMLWVGAREMFISPHDHAVVLTMLLFAALLAVGIALLCAAPFARRVEHIRAGTAHLAAGNLDTTLLVDGHDEIAALAADFNRMAAVLKQAAAHERELEQSRRNLIAAVSHDLRTPLAAVRALIEAVADGVADDPHTQARYLQSARHAIAHLSRLVDDLFELAQIDAGVLRLELERASLHDLISDTLSSFQPYAEQLGVRLVGEVTGNVDPVLISPSKLQRVLHNLVGNALRHTPADGTIAIRAQPHGNFVQVEVTDTGEGIPPEDMPHIFERTFRGERSRTRQGMEGFASAGLGLAIARGLIEAHGSTIAVESELGRGARFCFTLQRA